MKIALLITSISNFGEKGFYNSQEIGLAKSLSTRFNAVTIYKLVDLSKNEKNEYVDNYSNVCIKFIQAKNFGINGFINLNKLDANIDALVYFSDTQLMVPNVYHWCKKNDVKLIPYIGVIESHSDNKIKKAIIDILFSRNVGVYKKCTCMVKTPQVEKALNAYGIKNSKISPVGLDLSILHTGYEHIDVAQLKIRWGFDFTDKVILFIGRLVLEKQPIKLIDIFEQVHKQDSSYKLIIVGTGVLHDEVKNLINEKKLSASVRMVNKVPNTDIWELYRIADAFINLNQQEIFGMVILEAMYYGCRVVAWEAPGPNFIIENGVSGVLCKSDDEVVNGLLTENDDMEAEAHMRIIDGFTWSVTAKVIEDIC